MSATRRIAALVMVGSGGGGSRFSRLRGAGDSDAPAYISRIVLVNRAAYDFRFLFALGAGRLGHPGR
jgi:hypothetical protein